MEGRALSFGDCGAMSSVGADFVQEGGGEGEGLFAVARVLAGVFGENGDGTACALLVEHGCRTACEIAGVWIWP
ncbi:MAG: hypothetical protein PVS3B1_32520 [Ktedonobacteraceae bacterium]